VSIVDAFDRMQWGTEDLHFDGLHFLLEQCRTTNAATDSPTFTLHKKRDIVDEYRKFFALRPDFHPEHMLEVGIFKGGSLAFWREILKPKRIAALDILPDPRDSNLAAYTKSVEKETIITAHWSSDQTDTSLLRRIAKEDLNGRIDFVIDDATHEYHATKVTFQTIFPFMPPGSIYIIEDWAWNHWKRYQVRNSERMKDRSPSELAFELAESTGSASGVIDHIEIYNVFIAIVRGRKPVTGDFDLEESIIRRPFYPYKWAR